MVKYAMVIASGSVITPGSGIWEAETLNHAAQHEIAMNKKHYNADFEAVFVSERAILMRAPSWAGFPVETFLLMSYVD